ncbi:sulfatase [Lentisphaera profundi]|uniref:Sulfatase n=1 Tax=Lentisphaera profundi TaxID=1658616 RepID=A0ABY7VWH1_9BACT|nr:sulfatase [Lentisphaera profundi]WDE98585.1 sulfatase [Lentisphaera profundi]
MKYLLSIIFTLTIFGNDKPNIIFIAIDDLRNELACYGVDKIKTPHIDNLAKHGLIFDNAYCQIAICSPSRTSVLTGLRPQSTKVFDLTTHFRDTVPDVITLGQFFKQKGYITQGFGKIYHNSLDDPRSWSIKHFMSKNSLYQRAENQQLIKNQVKAAKEKKLKGHEFRFATMGPAYESADVPDEAYPDGENTKLAIKALKGFVQKKQPFFLALGFSKPHLPFNAPKKYWDLYEEDKLDPPAISHRPLDSHPRLTLTKSGEVRSYHGVVKEGSLGAEMSSKLKHGYYASVSYIDALIGKFLQSLKDTGLDKNTIVILWSDHGFKLGEYDSWVKHSNMEIDARVPLIISSPWMKVKGVRTNALVELVDIYPSLVDLSGFTVPTFLEGTSFAPLLKKPNTPWKKAAFSQYNRGSKIMGYSVRTAYFRYTEWRLVKNNKVIFKELYDQVNDPLQSRNIAKKEEVKIVQAELHEMINQQWGLK